MSENTCQFIPESQYVMAGWGCCKCRMYNGVWRKECKGCQHPRCVVIDQDVIDRQQKVRQELGYTDGRANHQTTRKRWSS